MAESSSLTTDGFLSFMPGELVQFILRDTYSLLIKGFAGTGKTTLSLTILRAMKKQSRFFYISTRTSPKQLFQYYPWLEEFANLKSGDGQIEVSEQSNFASFEDARLDEPESLFERITNQLMDIKSPVIVIDSWDAVASFMDKEARLNNERVLQTWRERAGAKLIFISEHPDDTTLDFLVDGVVELRNYHHSETRLREIMLHKMRGVRITRQSYFYTLEGAVFRGLPPYRPASLETLQLAKAVTGQSQASKKSLQYFSTGYETLDYSIGGGFPHKGIVLLELDEHVGTTVSVMFLGKLISKFLLDGNPVLLEPTDPIETDVLFYSIAPFIPKNVKGGLLKILSERRSLSSNGSFGKYFVSDSSTKKGKNVLPSAVAKMKGEHSNRPLLQIVSAQNSYDQSEDKCRTGDIHSTIFSSLRQIDRGLVVVVARTSNQDALKRLAEICNVHLKLMIVNGTLLMQSLLPSSTTFGVTSDPKDNFRLNLEPIV